MSNNQAQQAPAYQIPPEIETKIDDYQNRLTVAKAEIGRAILGQDELIENLMISMLAGGNALLVGVPGLAKTELAKAISKVFGLQNDRIQFTPDLMPSDILGAEILEEDKQTGERKFRFEEGPIFTQFLLADEINRASPRTQSALLQGMQEKEVTAGGQTRKLPKPFHVVATQNPIDQEGTNPLPEAQLDRFLVQLVLDYPDRDSEKDIMIKTTSTHHSWEDIFDENKEIGSPVNAVISGSDLAQVFNERQLIALQHTVRKIPLGDDVAEAILDIVRNARPDFKAELDGQKGKLSGIFNFVNENVEYGPGTRALQAFALTTRARALIHGRLRANLDDVVAMADPVLRHRLGLSIAARADKVDEAKVIEKLAAPFAPKPK